MNTAGKPSWEHLVWWLIIAIIGLQLLARVLPRLLVPLLVLALAMCVVRLVWFFTDRY